jgi:ABC-2 type transport system permease protein
MTGESISLAATGTTARGRKRKNIRAESGGSPTQPAKAQPVARAERPRDLPPGWRVIAAKEFADHVSSIRFVVLTLILTVAAAAAVYSAAGGFKALAATYSGLESLFLALFFAQPEGSQIPSFVFFTALLGPVLGIAFGFDGVNGERSEGTLPRLVSQPIHRDDVINGKFVAGLAAISVIFIAIVGVVSAIGVLQLGILPSIEDVVRLIIWIGLAVVYVGLWLGFALLCSVAFRRAATSALVALGVWLLLTLFANLLVGVVAGVISPVRDQNNLQELIANDATQRNLGFISPGQLFSESTQALLDPRRQTFDDLANFLLRNDPATRALASTLSLDQSLLIVWPQLVGLIALTCGAFAVAYVTFMRQEVRA